MSRQPSTPATVEQLARELIAAWPGWLDEADDVFRESGNDRQKHDQTLRMRVEEFLASAVCRAAGHGPAVYRREYVPPGRVPARECGRCGEDLG